MYMLQTYTPVQMQWNASQMIHFVCSVRLESLKVNRVPQSQSPPPQKKEQCNRRERSLCLWMISYWTPQASWILPCSTVQIEACSSSVHVSSFTPTLLKPQMANKRQTCYWRSIVLSVLMWQGFYGREAVRVEVFGEQLAGNADSSQQTGHRRVSVIVSLRENMNVCQKDC